MDDQTRLERTSLVIPGDRCELRLEDAGMTITKERGTEGQPAARVSFPIARVRGATLERPSRGRPGWLHVSVIGGTPAPTADLGAALDPYTLPITARNVAVARRLVRLVTQHVQRRGLPPEPAAVDARRSTSVTVTSSPTAPAPAPTPPPPTERGGGDLVGTLRELADLHASGALSDDEFERAKAKVLGDDGRG
jgi:hypothetical protein